MAEGMDPLSVDEQRNQIANRLFQEEVAQEAQQQEFRQRAWDMTQPPPDQAAEALSLSNKFGVPRQAIEADPDLWRRKDENARASLMREVSPRTLAWLDNEDNYAVAKDDKDILAEIESTFSKIGYAIKGGAQRFAAGGVAYERQAIGETMDYYRRLDAWEQREERRKKLGQDAPQGWRTVRTPDIGTISGFDLPIYYGNLDAAPGASGIVREQVRKALPATMRPMFMSQVDRYDAKAVRPILERKMAEVDARGRAVTAEFTESLEKARSDNFILNGLTQAMTSITEMAPSMAAFFVLRGRGGATVGSGAMGAQVFGAEYLEGVYNLNLDERAASDRALLQAGVEVVTERISLGVLDDMLKSDKGFLTKLGVSMAAEQIQEQAATLGNRLVDIPYVAPDTTVQQFLADTPEAAANTAITTLFAAGITNTTLLTIDSVARRMVTDSINASESAGDRAIKTLLDKAQKAKTSKRSPEKMAEFIEGLAEQSNLETVVVDLDGVVQALNQAGINPTETLSALGVSQDELQQRYERFGEIEVKTSTLVTSPAMAAHRAAIEPHVKAKQDAATPAQKEALRADFETALKDGAAQIQGAIDAGKTTAEKVAQVREAVKARILGAGIYPAGPQAEAMTDAMTAMLTTLPQRTGQDVLDFYAARAPKIQGVMEGEVMAEEDVLPQAQSAGYEGQDRGEAASWLRGVEKFGPEGMTTEARMARAAEQGWVGGVYHGTTANIASFDLSKANIESDWGAGIYLSNTPSDTAANYAGLGPDLTNKIEREAERIASETDRDYNDPEVIAEARAKWVQNEGTTMPLMVRLKNPVIVGGPNETSLTYEESYDEETDEYGEPTGSLVDFIENLRQVSDEFMDADVDAAVSLLMERTMDDGKIKISDVHKLVKEGMPYAFDPDTGDMANNEIVRRALERMGFDGIIDNTVDVKFGSQRRTGKQMEGMTPDTVHTIVFDPANIRSVHAAFDPDQSDSADLLAQELPAAEMQILDAETQEAITDPQTDVLPLTDDMQILDLDEFIAFHGTLAKFDKFETDKIGAGEGAQAFGPGHYFTQSRGIADWYRKRMKTLSPGIRMGKEPFNKANPAHFALATYWEFRNKNLYHEIFGGYKSSQPDSNHERAIERAISWLQYEIDGMRSPYIRREPQEYASPDRPVIRDKEELIRFLEAGIAHLRTLDPKSSKGIPRPSKPVLRGGGSIYTVAVKLPADQTIQYDKPFGQQPAAVQKAFREAAEAGHLGKAGAALAKYGDATRMDVLVAALKNMKSPAMDVMRANGIRGVRYLDGMSRGKKNRAGQSYNYVVFNDGDVKILDREGKLFQMMDQQRRGQYAPRTDIITLFEQADITTLMHESAHWYLETLYSMSIEPDAHPFVVEQYEAIRKWGKVGPDFRMYDDMGRLTPEAVELHESFAETFEVYLQTGKAPSASLRSAFQAFKKWITQLWKRMYGGGQPERANLNPEIVAVMDRMLAVDEEIDAQVEGIIRSAEQQADELLKRGIITKRQRDTAIMNLETAREGAKEDLMARLMEAKMREDEAWWATERARVRRDVLREFDKSPVGRALSWLGYGQWKGDVPSSEAPGDSEAEFFQRGEQVSEAQAVASREFDDEADRIIEESEFRWDMLDDEMERIMAPIDAKLEYVGDTDLVQIAEDAKEKFLLEGLEALDPNDANYDDDLAFLEEQAEGVYQEAYDKAEAEAEAEGERLQEERDQLADSESLRLEEEALKQIEEYRTRAITELVDRFEEKYGAAALLNTKYEEYSGYDSRDRYVLSSEGELLPIEEFFDDGDETLGQSIRAAARMPMAEVDAWVRANVTVSESQLGTDTLTVIKFPLTEDPDAPEVMLSIRLKERSNRRDQGRADVNLFLDNQMADALEGVEDPVQRGVLAKMMFAKTVMVMRQYAQEYDLKAFNFTAAESQAKGTNAKSREALYRYMLSSLQMPGYTAYEIESQTSIVNREEDGAKSADPMLGMAGFVIVKDGVNVEDFAKNEILRGSQRGGDVGEVVTVARATPLGRANTGDGGGRGRRGTGAADTGSTLGQPLSRDLIRPASERNISAAPALPSKAEMIAALDVQVGFAEALLADNQNTDLADVTLRLRRTMEQADNLPRNEFLGAWYANLEALARVADSVSPPVAASVRDALASPLGQRVKAVLDDRGVRILQAEQVGEPPVLLIRARMFEGETLGQSIAPTFYSALGRFVSRSGTARAPAAQWKGMITNAPGIKAEEVEWTGVMEWLDLQEGPVTREALAAFVEGNGVRVEEVVRGETGVDPDLQRQLLPLIEEHDRLWAEQRSIMAPRTPEEQQRWSEITARIEEIRPERERLQEAVNAQYDPDRANTKWSSYTLPGGENYREMLLTLPERAVEVQRLDTTGWRVETIRNNEWTGQRDIRILDADGAVRGQRSGFRGTDQEALNNVADGNQTAERREKSREVNFRSSHWSEPNVLAHVRFKERTGPNGERVLALEEIQSDWHQAGRERGYIEPFRLTAADFNITRSGGRWNIELKDGSSSIHPEVTEFPTEDAALAHAVSVYKEYQDRVGSRRVPNAPFKNNAWTKLVLKRMIRYAAENGFDAVAWIPGNVQNGRVVDADDNRGDFYDKIVPNIANKLGKKFGARVGRVPFEDALSDESYRMPEGNPVAVSYRAVQQAYSLKWEDGSVWGRFDSEEDAQSALDNWSPESRAGVLFHSLPITPELAAAAMTEGFPLFQPGDPKGWGETAPPPDLPPMRLDLARVEEIYGKAAVDALPKAIKDRYRDQTSVDSMLAAARGAAKTLKRKPPKTLFQFIRARKSRTVEGKSVPQKQWGIKDATDELKAMDRADLINEASGIDIDYMRELAEGAGYLPEGSTVNDLLNAIDREARGEPVYSEQDANEVLEIQSAQQWADWLSENGVDIFEADQRKLKAAIAKVTRTTNADLKSPDEAAELLGFETGEQLLKALAEAGSREQFIEAETDRRMREEFGDPFTTGEFAEAARQAAEAEVKFRAAEIEIEALSRALGETAASKLAKEMAMDALSVMTVKELAGWERFLEIERREMRNAMKAVQAGDISKALTHKRRQLVNGHLAKAAREKSEAIEKTRKDLLTYFTSKGRRDKIARDYLDKIEALLETYELRVSKQGPGVQRARLSAKEYVDQMVADGREAEIAPEAMLLAAQADKKVWRGLTVDEVEYLAGTVKNLAHLGRTKNSLMKAQDKRRFDAVVAELVDTLVAAPTTKDRRQSFTPTQLEKLGKGLREFDARLTRLEFEFQKLDGRENGPLWNVLFRPFTEAADAETREMRGAADRMRGLYEAFTASERQQLFHRRVSTPELDVPGKNMTIMDVVTIGLNWGNEGNRKALLDGYGWEAANVEAVLNRVLTDKHWDFIEGVWSLIGSYRDEAFALEKAITGVAPKAVEGIEFTLANGRTIKGKYYPLKYDGAQPRADSVVVSRLDEKQALSDLGKTFSKPMTKTGHLIERVGSGGKPVKLQIGVMHEHVQNVIHDIAYRRAVIDAHRIIRDPRFANAYMAAAGREQYDQLLPWLAAIATERNGDPGGIVTKLMQGLRRNMTIVAMGYKISTAVQQVTGPVQGMAMIGPVYTAQGFIRALAGGPGSFWSAWKWVAAKSEFMRDRPQGYDRDTRMVTNRMQERTPLGAMQRNSMILTNIVDVASSTIVWIGAYQRAMDGNVENIGKGVEEDAIAYADSVVRQTQAAGRIQDLPQIMRGTETEKLVTMMYSYFSGLYNLTRKQATLARYGQMNRAAFTANLILLFVVTPLMAATLAGRMFDDEDDEELVAKAGKEILSNATGTIPIFRDVAGATINPQFGYQMSPVGSGIDRLTKAAARASTGDSLESDAAVRELVGAMGLLFGLPSGQLIITGDYVYDLAMGEEDPMADPADAASEALLRNKR